MTNVLNDWYDCVLSYRVGDVFYDTISKEVLYLLDFGDDKEELETQIYEDLDCRPKVKERYIQLPHKEDLVQISELARLAEEVTGLDFETYRSGVARRMREAGCFPEMYEEELLEKRWEEWKCNNIPD